MREVPYERSPVLEESCMVGILIPLRHPVGPEFGEREVNVPAIIEQNQRLATE